MDEKSIPVQIPETEPSINTREIVLQLKSSIKSQGLTVQDVIEECEGEPNMPSSSTIRRIFGPDGENKNFSYRLTLKPLVKKYLNINPEALVVPPSASEEEHQIAGLKSVILAKEQICTIYEGRIKFLENQIEGHKGEMKRQADLFTKRIEKLDAELDKERAENEKNEKQRKFWGRLSIIVLIFFILYLLVFDIPNGEFGLVRYEAFIEQTAAFFGGSHTGGLAEQIGGWMRF